MNRTWERRRRNARLWRAIRRGLKVLRREPHRVVELPEGLVMISAERYDELTGVIADAVAREQCLRGAAAAAGRMDHWIWA